MSSSLAINEVVWTRPMGAWQIEIVPAAGTAHQAYEQELRAAGVALPFASNSAVAALPENSPGFFVAVLDTRGACVGGFAVSSRPVRIVPGHSVLRIENYGLSVPLGAHDAVIQALRAWLARTPTVLRLSVDLFSFDAEHRASFAAAMQRHGFRRPSHVNGYLNTLVLDLTPTEEELFASVHHSARRKVRQVEKLGLIVKTVDDPGYATRMNDLLLETFSRTGGAIHSRDWPARIDMSKAVPELSRIIGLFNPQISGPESLIAFAWGCNCGEYVFYSEAASTRDTGEQRVAVAYALMWDLIVWAKRTGARQFDFGGITHGSHTTEDPLGGISDFKRYFSKQVVEVREEWILDDHSLRASLVSAVHRRLRGG